MNTLLICYFIWSLSCLAQSHKIQAEFEAAEKELTSSIGEYRKNERPRPIKLLRNKNMIDSSLEHLSVVVDDTLLVEVNAFVDSFSSISVVDMDYSMNVLLRQRWQDPRLSVADKYNVTKIPINYLKDKIWIPDLFFRNAKSGALHDITVPNYLLWVNNEGVVTFSQKLSIKLSCHMDLWNFPMDSQLCKLDMGSYGYSQDNVDFRWWVNSTYDPFGDVDFTKNYESAIKVRSDIHINEFDLAGHSGRYCKTNFNSTGSFACLLGIFLLERKFGFYLIYAYAPSLLIAIIAWLSFFIDHQAVPARISIGLLCVLSLMTQSAATLNSLPRVSYVKAIDLWIFSCLAFVVMAFLEFAVVNSMHRKLQNKKYKELAALNNSPKKLDADFANEILNSVRVAINEVTKEQQENEQNMSTQSEEDTKIRQRRPSKQKQKYSKVASNTQKSSSTWKPRQIDNLFAITFPILIIIFNIFYWSYFVIFVPQRRMEFDNMIGNATA